MISMIMRDEDQADAGDFVLSRAEGAWISHYPKSRYFDDQTAMADFLDGHATIIRPNRAFVKKIDSFHPLL